MAINSSSRIPPRIVTFSALLNKIIEALWLLTVVLVPLAFLDQDHIFSEAEIAFVEIPKIAILRAAVGLMTCLWLINWGINGRFPNVSWPKKPGTFMNPSTYFVPIFSWLREQPTRWLILAVWFFLFSTLVSTIFSASVKVSLWGEIPGQDGLSAYTLISHILLFGVITAHLKTRPQLWRLLSAIVVTGVLVAGFAVTQHYGSPFFGISESANLGGARVTATMGNAVFAGAAMLIPISISLLLANVSIQQLSSTKRFTGTFKLPLVNLLALATWTIILTIQFLGIIFTFSRGPWLGTFLALSGFLALSLLFIGWRGFGRACLILGWSALLTAVIILTSGSVLTSNIGLLIWTLLIMSTVFIIAKAFQHSLPLTSPGRRIEEWSGHLRLSESIQVRLVGGIIMALGVAAAMAFGIFVVLPSSGLTSTASNEDISVSQPETTSGSNLSIQITERFGSVADSILSGDIANRVNLWRGSLILMRDHPWFEFDDLSLRWMRPIVGYGPDMFRYTYLLVSVPLDARLLPMEPDHAHNFFLNQGVEQGLLGLISSLGIFLAVLCVGAYQLIWKSKSYSALHQLVLVGLVATVTGRFLEQTVGLSKVSDLMLFWVILAVFAALPVAIQSHERATEPTRDQRLSTRSGRMRRSSKESNQVDMIVLFWLILLAWAVGGILSLTWVKTINYPRAAITASESADNVRVGDYQLALQSLDQASRLAPDVPVYHTTKSAVYLRYLNNPQLPPHTECSLELNGVRYKDCLAQNIHLNNIIGSDQRPLDWKTRLSRADSALALGLEDEAIRLYSEVVELIPGSWPLHNRLAEAYIDIGQPWEALLALEESIAITRESRFTGQAEDLRRIALKELESIRESNKTSESDRSD